MPQHMMTPERLVQQEACAVMSMLAAYAESAQLQL